MDTKGPIVDALRERNWCVHQNGLHNSGATQWRAVVFSRVMFGPRDHYSSGVDRSGDHYPTRAFFLLQARLLVEVVVTSYFFYKKRWAMFFEKIINFWKKANKTGNRNFFWNSQTFFLFYDFFLNAWSFLNQRTFSEWINYFVSHEQSVRYDPNVHARTKWVGALELL